MKSNVASSTNNSTIFNSLVIPNENNNPSNNHSVIIHKAKKFNYLCDINPGKIGRITGKITNLAGAPMFHGAESTTATHTYTLTGIDQTMTVAVGGDDNIFPFHPGDIITVLAHGGTALDTSITGVILAYTNANASELHFSYGLITLDELAFFNAGDNNITFNIERTSPAIANQTITLLNTGIRNKNLSLRRGSGRFIAEFSINSRE